MDPGFTQAEALAIRHGRIAGVGSMPEIEAGFRSPQCLDVEGACICPGFFDPHSHFLGYGLTLGMANLAGARSWGEVLERCQPYRPADSGSWLLCRGWDQNLWTPAVFPTRELLDQAFPGVPVLLVRVDGHAAIANAAALERAGVDTRTQVAGGEFLAENDRLTGVLIDLAVGPSPGGCSQA